MNTKTESMLDMWGDEVEIQSVVRSINGYSTVYLTIFGGEVPSVAILDLEKLDQIITLLQNARQRITEE